MGLLQEEHVGGLIKGDKQLTPLCEVAYITIARFDPVKRSPRPGISRTSSGRKN
jgi:hypothetical protein